MSNEETRKLDLRGEICPYPMLKTNEELDSNKDINILEVITDHSPALSTIPPQALKRGYEVEIDEIDNSEPHRYPKKFHEAIKPPSVLVIFNSSNIKGSIGV